VWITKMHITVDHSIFQTYTENSQFIDVVFNKLLGSLRCTKSATRTRLKNSRYNNWRLVLLCFSRVPGFVYQQQSIVFTREVKL
jgi:hypothetical protein